MEIKVQVFGKVYSVCIGYKTKWFSQMSFVTIEEEELDAEGYVCWARLIFRS